MSFIRTLAFSRWPFPPEPDEPVHGYFLRLIEAQGATSVTVFRSYADVATRNRNPDQMLAIIDRHPMPDDWKELLRSNTPTHNDAYHFRWFRGIKFGGREVAYGIRRWCPGCIEESPHFRSWWYLTSIHRCPFHDEPLICQDPHGKEITWYWSSFRYSPDGVPLGRRCEISTTAQPYARYLLGRLGYLEPTPATLLDKESVPDVIAFCNHVGRLLTNKRSKGRKGDWRGDAEVFEQGYLALSKDLAHLAERLRLWLRVQRKTSGRTLASQFGWGVSSTNALPLAELRAEFLRAAHAAHTFFEEGIDREITEEDLAVEYVTRSEIAKVLHMPQADVSRVFDLNGISRLSRRVLPYSRIALDQVIELRKGMMSLNEAADRMNIDRSAVGHLVAAGYIRFFPGLRRDDRRSDGYLAEDVERVVEAIERLDITGETAYGLTFFHYTRVNRLKSGQAAIGVLRGNIPICARDPSKPGFRGLLVHNARKRKRRGPVVSPDTLSLIEALTLLGTTYATLKKLVRIGMIEEVERNPKLVLVSRKSVEDFDREYGRAADFAVGLGMTSSEFNKFMLAEGIEPADTDYEGQRYNDRMVSREAVTKALGLKEDPTVVDDPRFMPFWKSVLEEAKEVVPFMRFPERPRAAGQRAWNSARNMSVRFEFRKTTGHVQIELAVGKNRDAFVIDLNEPWDTSTIKAIFAVFADHATAIRLDRNAKTQKWYADNKGTTAEDKRGKYKRVNPKQNHSQHHEG